MSETVKLTKGENINLSKEAPGMNQVVVGLGWDVNEGVSADLDAMCFLLTTEGKVRSAKDFIYYGMDRVGGKLATADGAVEHTGDNLTGEGDGDDEQIKIDLSKVPADVDRIVVLVDIYEAAQKNQNFGQVKNAFVRLVNGSDYPLPAINSLIWTRSLVRSGFITAEERQSLNEIYDYNPLLFDFVLKRTMRHPETKQKLATSVFMENPGLEN